ncbi:tRNA (adenosine(37)-N6)-threonylcarbamoyltransferase complex ATPase subunit type 1 TsaE [Patescibacteria group bacterium]|nr:tRNA (adenosine(37)-N6)-threonylcarbamoyltransferase complex ATPase subunit type 1 TsaE [Patescibacteria group bacterium]
MRQITITGKKKPIVVTSLAEMEHFAIALAKKMRGGEVLALSGTLGAGKTTFTQFFGKALGVKSRITSPTFTLMQVHHIPALPYAPTPVRPSKKIHFVHIDAYRLRGAKSLVAIGALDYIGQPHAITVIEWAERVKKVLPEKTIFYHLTLDKEEKML